MRNVSETGGALQGTDQTKFSTFWISKKSFDIHSELVGGKVKDGKSYILHKGEDLGIISSASKGWNPLDQAKNQMQSLTEISAGTGWGVFHQTRTEKLYVFKAYWFSENCRFFEICLKTL